MKKTALKRFIALILIMTLGISLIACGSDGSDSNANDNGQSNTQQQNGNNNDNDGNTPTPDPDPDPEPDPEPDPDPEPEPEPEPEPDIKIYPWNDTPKTLKILAIGNSFSVDAMEYLYNIAKSAGVETVVLGNLRISGCSIDTHYANSKSGAAAYTYLKNTSGSWVTTENYTLANGIKDEEWDYITLQQASELSGLPKQYRGLNKLIEFVNQTKTNPDAKLLWHMTWAYQKDCTRGVFSNYDKDQTKMYNAIISTVQSVILERDAFAGIIPSGTAVQNARTSFLGDTLTRDGYHMSYGVGRYIVGLTYFAAITGADISDITFSPSADVTPYVMEMAKESVKNAMASMYEVTESTYKEADTSGAGNEDINGSNEEILAADTALLASQGLDIKNYTRLEYEYLSNQYYTATSSISAGKSSSSQSGKFICTKNRYTKEQLLNAIIICDSGWQFRPEAWKNATDVATVRGDKCSDNITVLNESFWGENTYLALNISANPQVSIASNYAQAAMHLRIYVPNT